MVICIVTQGTDIRELENEVVETNTTESRFFSYTPSSTYGIIRVTVTNTGTTDIIAKLQKCQLPGQNVFGIEDTVLDSCEAISADSECELVVKICDFDPKAKYFIDVQSVDVDDKNEYSIIVNEKGIVNLNISF